jgi:hypothetical protein
MGSALNILELESVYFLEMAILTKNLSENCIE